MSQRTIHAYLGALGVLWATWLLPLIHALGHGHDHVHTDSGHVHMMAFGWGGTDGSDLPVLQHGHAHPHHHAHAHEGGAKKKDDHRPGSHSNRSLEHGCLAIAPLEMPIAELPDILPLIRELELVAVGGVVQPRAVTDVRTRGPPPHSFA